MEGYNFKDNVIVSDVPNNFRQLRRLDYFMVGHKGFIAGGAFKNLFNNEPVKDVDIFFESLSDWDDAVTYFTNHENFVQVYSNNKVTAFKDNVSGIILELIRFMFGTPMEIVSKFDFTIVKFAYFKDFNKSTTELRGGIDNDVVSILSEEEDELPTWKVMYHKQFFEHLHLKRTVIDQPFDLIDKPVNTLNRSYRYAKYGYHPCRETKVKIIQSLREMDRFEDNDLSLDLYNGFD